MLKTGRFNTASKLLVRAFLLSALALQCNETPLRAVASNVLSFAYEHTNQAMWGEMPSIEDISGKMIFSVASTLTHISLASTKRGHITVYTIRKVVLPATKAGMLQLAKDLRKVHKKVIDIRTLKRTEALAAQASSLLSASTPLSSPGSTARLRPDISARVLHSYPFHHRDLFDHADCLSIVPNLPLRKFGMLEAAMVRTFMRVAQRRGLQLISELTDDVIAALVPSESTLGRALEFWQKTIDIMHEDLFSGCLFIYSQNDAGNKKKLHLTQRLLCGFHKATRRVIIRHVGSSIVATGQLASVVMEDAIRRPFGFGAAHRIGSP